MEVGWNSVKGFGGSAKVIAATAAAAAAVFDSSLPLVCFFSSMSDF